MNVVLADIDTERLETAVAGLKADGHAAIGVPTDVSKEDQIQALAQAALDEFGVVHFQSSSVMMWPSPCFLSMGRKVRTP